VADLLGKGRRGLMLLLIFEKRQHKLQTIFSGKDSIEA
jgi:hypothetical protein